MNLIALIFASSSLLTATYAFSDPAAEGVAVDAGASTAPTAETAAERDARMAWWREAKFGLFIHWGVYAVPAGKYGEKTSYGEWIMRSASIPVATYRDFARQFNPSKYDPERWTQIASDAGMRYIVITAKHHDGFALYPSKASTWNIVDASPYAKDLLGPLVRSAKGRGLKVGFYYSQCQDWNNPGGAKSGLKEGEGWDEAHKGDYDEYLKTVAVPQVRELLSNYPIDILWWDTPMHMTRERAAPLAALLNLRPGIITNNRLGQGFKGDTETPEQFIPAKGYPGDWETCMTMNGHWGYNAYDNNWKSSTDLIRKLAEICSKGGNFLLNVGPTAEGEFPPACVERLKEIGEWMRINSDSIYGTAASPFPFLPWGCATRKGDRLYLHVFEWPQTGRLNVPMTTTVKRAYLLAKPEVTLNTTTDGKLVRIELPPDAPDKRNSVVVVEVNGKIETEPVPSNGASVVASDTLEGTSPQNLVDGTTANRWRAGTQMKVAWAELTLRAPASIGAFSLDEPDVWPRLKQHYKLEAKSGDNWVTIAEGDTNGHGVTRQTTAASGQVFRITMSCEAGSPGIAELQLFSID